MHWLLFVYGLLPIGLISLILVSLPTPSKMGQYLNSKLVRLGSVKVPYMRITIIHFLIVISILTFILTTNIAYKHSKIPESNWNGIGISPTCIRWRAERNFWICTTNVIVYWTTYIIYNMKKTLYEERLIRKIIDRQNQEEKEDQNQEEKEDQNQEEKNLPSIKGKIISVLKIVDTLNTRAMNLISNEEKLADLEAKKNN